MFFLIEEDEDWMKIVLESLSYPTLCSTHVCLNSISGLTPHNTSKMKGTLYTQSISILIDGGTTHNFISTSIIHEAIITGFSWPSLHSNLGG